MKKRGELLLLHRHPYSETSWVIKALGRESGLVSLLAKGARRQKSPMAGALEPLSLSEILWSQRPEAELGILEKAMLLEPWNGVRGDLLKNATAMTLSEIPLRMRPEGEGNEAWFDLLLSGLRWLEKKEELSSEESAQLVSRFVLRIASECGVGLEHYACVSCEGELEHVAALVGERGGFLCRECAAGEEERLATPLFDLMRGRSSAPLLQLEAVEGWLLTHLSERLGIPLRLRSLEWLRALRRT